MHENEAGPAWVSVELTTADGEMGIGPLLAWDDDQALILVVETLGPRTLPPVTYAPAFLRVLGIDAKQGDLIWVRHADVTPEASETIAREWMRSIRAMRAKGGAA